jgi:Flp pilus assembly protein TadG
MIAVRHNKRLLRRPGFTGDQKGVAAVEFALIFPVMMVLYLGSVELLQGISINRQVASPQRKRFSDHTVLLA